MEPVGDGANANNGGNAAAAAIAKATVCEQLRAPPALECTTETLARIWKPWKDEVTLYMDLAHANKTEGYKVKMLKYLLGTVGRQVYETLTFDNEEDAAENPRT